MPRTRLSHRQATKDATGTRLADEQVTAYLGRLGLAGPVSASIEFLTRLHAAHLLAVPFENLDLHADRPIRLDIDALYRKIVTERRGGFCYELNELFRALLASIGFDAQLVSSRVWLPDGTLSPPFDHAALLVELDGPWLVDVGFGDAFTTPHPLGDDWSEPGRRLRTVPTDGGWRLEVDEGQGWVPVYDLDPTPRHLEEFVDRCRWHETDPASFFRQVLVVTRATTTGRVTVMGNQLLVTSDGTRTERELSGREALAEIVGGYFDEPVVEQLRQLPNVSP